uniref:Uncharacterized protein n=1 Tax=Setaria digitata TaxID=48799 RepID=A0A915PKQ4_9BILA
MERYHDILHPTLWAYWTEKKLENRISIEVEVKAWTKKQNEAKAKRMRMAQEGLPMKAQFHFKTDSSLRIARRTVTRFNFHSEETTSWNDTVTSLIPGTGSGGGGTTFDLDLRSNNDKNISEVRVNLETKTLLIFTTQKFGC